QQSEWRRIVIASVLTFLCSVENSMLAVGEWPYMSEIDPDATASFFGTATAISKSSHAIFAFAFAFWARKSCGMKIPLLVGRLIALSGCICYLFVEFLQDNRRWWMLFCYVLFGAGYSASVLLRSSIARASSPDNRTAAYAMQNGAAVLSVTVGPVGQIVFSGIPYPGITIFSDLRLSVFTAPIWLALITNIIAIFFITFMFQDFEDSSPSSSEAATRFTTEETKESMNELTEEETGAETASTTMTSVGVLRRLLSLDLPWLLIAVVIVERVVSQCALTTTQFLAGPVLTTEFALAGEEATLALSICQCIVGVLAMLLSLSFYFFKLGNRVGCRLFFLMANILVVSGYLITYPYPFLSEPIQLFNATTKLGCDPERYSWCETQRKPNLVVFLVIVTLMLSFALPVSNLCLDTIYSKVIGSADQNLMQSVFVIADDVALIATPIYASQVFAAAGYAMVQIVNGSVAFAATILWIADWKRLGRYN
ncbi:hypothetical protein PENTCL1PPCAC_4057, partial [Pristionchus entomophagus]